MTVQNVSNNTLFVFSGSDGSVAVDFDKKTGITLGAVCVCGYPLFAVVNHTWEPKDRELK